MLLPAATSRPFLSLVNEIALKKASSSVRRSMLLAFGAAPVFDVRAQTRVVEDLTLGEGVDSSGSHDRTGGVGARTLQGRAVGQIRGTPLCVS